MSFQQDSGVAQRLIPVRANFADLAAVARERGVEPLDGILLDLGLSSFQPDQPARGFAFRHEGPLDMRFDPEQGAPASDLVNTLSERELADLIWRYGEEPGSAASHGRLSVSGGRADRYDDTTREYRGRCTRGRRGRDIHPQRAPSRRCASRRTRN